MCFQKYDFHNRSPESEPPPPPPPKRPNHSRVTPSSSGRIPVPNRWWTFNDYYFLLPVQNGSRPERLAVVLWFRGHWSKREGARGLQCSSWFSPPTRPFHRLRTKRKDWNRKVTESGKRNRVRLFGIVLFESVGRRGTNFGWWWTGGRIFFTCWISTCFLSSSCCCLISFVRSIEFLAQPKLLVEEFNGLTQTILGFSSLSFARYIIVTTLFLSVGNFFFNSSSFLMYFISRTQFFHFFATQFLKLCPSLSGQMMHFMRLLHLHYIIIYLQFYSFVL